MSGRDAGCPLSCDLGSDAFHVAEIAQAICASPGTESCSRLGAGGELSLRISVKENLWDLENWKLCDDEIILDKHEMP